METSIINRDLARWSRRQWFWAVAALAGFELGLLFLLRQPARPDAVLPAEPVLELSGNSGLVQPAGWMELQDPMLFAAPNWHNVSGMAWMKKPEFQLSVGREFPPIQFLTYSVSPARKPEAEGITLNSSHVRLPAEPLVPVAPPAKISPRSRMVTDGFANRQPVTRPELPTQLHNDAVSRTEVEAAIDPEGLVLSARVIVSSGSRRADSDAINLTRSVRFEAAATFDQRAQQVVWGKLIFEWHALDLNQTNKVSR